ncbi:pleckstrin homology domain-containing family H member 1-like isoform X2 [Lytechinus variegatus]|uniref:pleckstrin homology domain-containing family H member 1-like isoform X2 n=1 Tax=Lytechinus variegatus TaxID=7654 RepID=UPI001BB13894|nr:pleckstrin homology domain-containing family H member 1-like isoform X2 [Lytechinus variegatus]
MATRTERCSSSEGQGQGQGSDAGAAAGDVDWKERCRTLEGQLEKFRLQATKIRSVLGEKMQELEEKVQVSTTRAEKAEKEVEELKKKLEDLIKSESKQGSQEQKQASNKRIIALEGLCREKEDIIQHLEQQLREQQDLRAQESLVVESKVTKIKKWVAATVGELEEENKRLVILNEDANDTIRKLQLRLKNQENGQYHADTSGRSNGSDDVLDVRPDSALSEDPPLIPARPTSSSIRDHLIAVTTETELNGNDIHHRQEVTSEIYDNVEEEPLFAVGPVINHVEDGAKKDWRTNRNESNSNNGQALTPGSEMSGSEEDNLIDSADLDHSMSLLSTSSGGLSPDIPLATLAPPPTPSTPVGEDGANLAQCLIKAQDKQTTRTKPPRRKSSRNDDEVIPSALSLIADSVSATAEMLQNSVKPKHFPIMELNNGETLDISLPTFERTVSNAVHNLEFDSTLEGFDDDVFLEGGYARSSDYAELLRTRSLSQQSGQDDSYQSLKKVQMKKMQNGVLMEGSQDILEVPELPSSEEGYQSLRNVHDHFDNLRANDAVEALPDVCGYEGGGDEKSSPAFDPAFDLDYDEPPDDDSLLMEESADNAGSRESVDSGKPPPPPERKAPSWETRIYALAENGLKMSPSVAPVIDSSVVTPVPVCLVEEGSSTNSLFRDVDVPVYTTLRGRLTLIRSTPFTGESSDSSDDESSSKPPPPPASHSSPHGSLKFLKSSKGTGGSLKLTSSSSMGSPKKKMAAGSSSTLPSAGQKRGVSTQSSASDADYSIPPDAIRSHDGNSSDEPEPKAKLLKTCSLDKASKSSSDSLDKSDKEPLEKAGWLTKLGGRVKTWKRRWFVLKVGQSELLYYKSPNDTSRKPRGQVPLDKFCKIAPSEGLQTFELATSKRTYYLTAESPAVMEEWIKLIERVLEKYRKPSELPLALPQGVTMQGWVTKVKLGNSKRCWFVLADRNLKYFKSDKDKSPLGSIDMREASVSEVDQSAVSDDEGDEKTEPTKFTLSIISRKPDKQSTTFLNYSSQEEKDSWLYHLMVASGGSGSSSPDGGTEFENIIKKLMNSENPLSSPLWKHPVMLYSKESRDRPLTTLLSDALSREAVKFSKACNLFISSSVDMPAVDYHVNLAQNALQTGLSHTELQNEMYCQLIKQTNHRPALTKAVSADDSTGDNSSSNHVISQAWQLLAMICQLFLPSHQFMWLLKTHLQRLANSKTEGGKYAIFCQRSVERTNRNGRREARPSKLEVLSIVQRHPYYHSKPISIPVHFANNTYQVVGFDSSMTIKEFLRQLNHHSGMRSEEESGFALFTDDPSGKQIQHCLQTNVKICDVISKWEQAFKECKAGKKDGSKIIRLTYKHKEYQKQCSHSETDRERLLLAYQVNSDLVAGRFPVSKEMALELASLMAQVDLGDCKLGSTSEPSSGPVSSASNQTLETILERFYPIRYQPAAENERRKLKHKINEKWNELRGRSQTECIRIYVTVLRKWRHFGAYVIPATCKYGKQERVWLTVCENGLSILEFNSLEDKISYPLSSIVTFGGCRDDFMLVVRKQTEDDSDFTTDKLMFDMTKAKVSQLTHLISHFIRTMVKAKGLPPGPLADEKHRKPPPQPKQISSIKSSKTSLASSSSAKSKDSKDGVIGIPV